MNIKKKIVKKGKDNYQNHRPSLDSCPHCSFEMNYDEWTKNAHTLILEPRMYRKGCVAVMTECPECFESSWIHQEIDSVESNYGGYPEDWQTKAKVLGVEIKLRALREWGACICWKCKHLECGTVDYHTYRTCKIGIGGAVKECHAFEEFKK